jgi:hypothetical protein
VILQGYNHKTFQGGSVCNFVQGYVIIDIMWVISASFNAIAEATTRGVLGLN